MLSETGCDGVMVGRAAISNPWALARISAALTGKPTPVEPTLIERISVALEHLDLMIDYETTADPTNNPELRACRALRGQMPLYIKGTHGASVIRDQLTRCSTRDEFAEILHGFAASATTSCPN